MKRVISQILRGGLAAALCAVGLSAKALAAPVLNQAIWNASVHNDTSFSTGGVTWSSKDGFATRFNSTGGFGAQLTLGAGSINGTATCSDQTFPCLGAYQFTLVLPFAISGVSGDLTVMDAFGLHTNFTIAGDAVPLGPIGLRTGYTGFFGDTFGPTTTLGFFWMQGLLSADDSVTFNFSNVRIIPVPEPETLALILVALGAVGIARRAFRVA
ncbi:MAG TPA: PEP-CTERM sorting domain-containing protein [Candidatus Cybelea sp.]|nr:PEP-CTERM sorting domain-containing protein [Candidatus Cybelea sp.]